MKTFGFLVVMLTLSSLSFAATTERGSIVLYGNELKAPQLTLRSDSLFADQQLIRAGKPIIRSVDHQAQSTVSQDPRTIINRSLDSLCALGIQPTTTDVAQRYRSLGTVVDSVAVNELDRVVWVYWHAGFAEEVNAGCRTTPAATTNTNADVLEVWEHALATGGRIYIGQTYTVIVPAQRVVEFEAGLRDPHGSLTRAKYIRRYQRLRNDLAHPTPLNISQPR
jgi:hypothetical protein